MIPWTWSFIDDLLHLLVSNGAVRFLTVGEAFGLNGKNDA
jgi:hypothetical protein